MNPSSTIVFFGSGPVAAATLTGLLDAGLTFEAIITKPRAEGHHGSVPVLELATQQGLPLFTPTNKAQLSELFRHHAFKSSVGLVVDYGIIIAKDVIESFSKGIINSHFSLLPEWRGADPITFSILSGQTITGVSLMLINERLDEGKLLSQRTLSLHPDIIAPELTQQLITTSNSMIARDLPRYLSGDITPHPQSSASPATYSRKLTKQDGFLDFSKPADRLEREIRAFRGWPKSKTTLFNNQVVVTKARVAQSASDGLLVMPAGNHTFLEVLQLIAPSGRSMTSDAFIRGYKK